MFSNVTAMKFLRPIGDGYSQPVLFLCDDGRSYVIKNMLNSLGPRLLPNEWIAYNLGKKLGLPLPEAKIVHLPLELLRSIPVMGGTTPMLPGFQFGSLYEEKAISNPTRKQILSCVNLDKAADMIVFDHWIKNWDRCWLIGKNIMVQLGEKNHILLIDQGAAFTGSYWNPITLAFDAFNMYSGSIFWGENYQILVNPIDGRTPFDKALETVEALDSLEIRKAIAGMPPEWNVTPSDINAMVDFLIHRKRLLPHMIKSLRKYFPKWRSKS
jgi:hypothetical protein